jgi:hypothetical protein
MIKLTLGMIIGAIAAGYYFDSEATKELVTNGVTHIEQAIEWIKIKLKS